MQQTSTARTVCLIDDDHIYQFTAKRIIQLVNPLQKVLAFSNGKEAIDYFRQGKLTSEDLPDIIFLDINMPIMNGWEFLEAYTAVRGSLGKPIHIYMVSSSVDEGDKNRSKCYDCVKDFIVKPLDKDMMLSILQPSAAVA